jgi:hypothetical protein
MGSTKEEKWWAQDRLKEKEREILKKRFQGCKKEGLERF